jgi:zinc transport system substrate-binding protein
MKKILILIIVPAFLFSSCGNRSSGRSDERIITVSIPPFAWFVEAVAGDDFKINIMLPAGADHHIWEPLPAQINSLSGSEALIINGQLVFEHAWMKRFMQVNSDLKILDLSRNIELIGPGETRDSEHHNHEGHKSEGLGSEGHKSEGPADTDHDAGSGAGQGYGHSHGGPDPHYWMSPVSALIMADDITDFLVELNPEASGKYKANLALLKAKITEVDSLVREAVASAPARTVLIYHPALAYMGRDYGFEQVSFEDEGKDPSPARMKELIDLAREKGIKTIFIQAEYDLRNAGSLSRETGARLIVINPMNRDWPAAVIEVAQALGSDNELRIKN